ncbi:PKD domain-containing protein [Leifsonia sp. YIM 134122]|uniref:PKD domain-containing protein n=1 Tax=Leifsonia stereocauli TaxID=3134136 RepID=A0ABU9W8K5_9MICO
MRFSASSRILSFATAIALSAGLVLVAAQPATADTAPPDPTTPETVSADALPTPQIDGVVWNQQVAGNTVFVGGDFQNARPAGSAAGVNTVTRTHLMSYNITNGVMTNWAPNANGRIRGMTLSPDKSTLYVVGNFTSIAGATRYRVAAFNTSTGALLPFAPVLNGRAAAVAVANSTVYVVGSFTTANGQARTGAVAYSTGGTLKTQWNPVIANGGPLSVVIKSDGSKVILGGDFQSVNGQSNPGYGLASLDGATAAMLPFNVNTRVRNADTDSMIFNLAADEDGVYGVGAHYGLGTLEGTFFASWDTGDIKWIEDCHGDSYSVFPMGDVVYTASHAHYCGNIGGFPQTEPTWTMHRALAFSKAVGGTITNDPYGYTNWAGTPRPNLLDWFPDINTGSFTGTGQGAWNVNGNSDYILYGGEFTIVNSVRTQGLVRFAKRSLATNKEGPRLSGTNFVPNVVSFAAGTARVSWLANYDRDNAALKYEVIRNNATATPVFTKTVSSNFYTRPTTNFVDTGLTPGQTYNYRIRVTDPTGNTFLGANVPVTIAASGTISPYAQAVLDDSPTDYWRLGESSGSTVYDWAGMSDAVAGAGVGRGATGAINGDSNTASTFNGTGSGFAASQDPIVGPNNVSIEAWFKTTSTAGGKIVGFGDRTTGTSNNYDRHIYMDGSGRVKFGVWVGSSAVLQSAPGLNNGQWHQVVANLGPTGMQLFIDGVRVGQRTDVTAGQNYSGYWRIGGDTSWEGANFFNGSIDDVAIYPQAQSIQQVNEHYTASGRTSALPTAPADSYGARVYSDNPDFYWRLNDAVGAGTAADSGIFQNPGSYQGGVTKQAAGAIAGTTNKAASFNGSNGVVVSTVPVSNPTVYSLEAWFKTTTTSGGKLIGFGDAASGTSSSYDRHVYLQDDGKIVFGTYTGQLNTITTNGAFNDGVWHHVVATQAGDGMKLYVDGALNGTNPQTAAQAYDGYWRVGGDITWGSSSSFLNATIDDAAVYSAELDSDTIAAHYALGTGTTPNVTPTASFTATPGVKTVSVDGSASSDPDGSIVGYAWNFGDGGTATGATAAHPYATGGDYVVTLTVTDNRGGTATTSSTVTVSSPPPNVLPTAAFSTVITNLAVAADGSGSTDSDGTVVGYAWNFGVPGATASGPTASYTYAAAGTYTVSLTVTDDEGGTNTKTTSVTVAPAPPPNVAPTASFTSSAAFLKLSVDASASSDSDGTIAGYAWNFGDGGTGSGELTDHTYGSAGTYTVTLTVTDDDGAATVTTASVSVTAPPPNVLPTASFTSNVSNLSVTVNGSGSSDPDGTIASYGWNYGDGGTATGPTPAAHVYAASGTYTVTLTVTDNRGGTGVTTSTITVAAPPGPTIYATDLFGRTASSSWGTADVGGPWSLTGGAAAFSVAGGAGKMTPALGYTTTGYLRNVSSTDTDVKVAVSLDKPATGTGVYASVFGRVVGTTTYGAKLRFYPSGTVTLSATNGPTLSVPGVVYAAGDQLNVRVQVFGTSPTTIRAKVWKMGDSEPAAWQTSVTDSTAALQAAGGVGLQYFTPTAVTNAPVTASFDNLWAGATQ